MLLVFSPPAFDTRLPCAAIIIIVSPCLLLFDDIYLFYAEADIYYFAAAATCIYFAHYAYVDATPCCYADTRMYNAGAFFCSSMPRRCHITD